MFIDLMHQWYNGTDSFQYSINHFFHQKTKSSTHGLTHYSAVINTAQGHEEINDALKDFNELNYDSSLGLTDNTNVIFKK
jgi:hypothetical protein